MKKNLLFLFVLYSLQASSQGTYFISQDEYSVPTAAPKDIDKYKVIDSTAYIITYKLDYILDINRKEQRNDIIFLEIGNHISKSYSKTLYDADSVASAWMRRKSDVVPSIKKYVPPMEVYKNFPDAKRTVTYRPFYSGLVYKYEEDMEPFHWQLLPDKATILSYACQKALMSFKGRSYEAWFTADIPLPEGPWKFGGLPGLILKIQDTAGHYVFECIGLQKPKEVKQIQFFLWNYEAISRKELLKFERRMHLNTFEYLQTIGQKIYIMNIPDEKQEQEARKLLKSPHNPIELE